MDGDLWLRVFLNYACQIRDSRLNLDGCEQGSQSRCHFAHYSSSLRITMGSQGTSNVVPPLFIRIDRSGFRSLTEVLEYQQRESIHIAWIDRIGVGCRRGVASRWRLQLVGFGSYEGFGFSCINCLR